MNNFTFNIFTSEGHFHTDSRPTNFHLPHEVSEICPANFNLLKGPSIFFQMLKRKEKPKHKPTELKGEQKQNCMMEDREERASLNP